MPKQQIIAEKNAVLVLKDERGVPVAVVIRNSQHWVFFEVSEMNDEAIAALFPKEEVKA